jgi:hypothetical protein
MNIGDVWFYKNKNEYIMKYYDKGGFKNLKENSKVDCI